MKRACVLVACAAGCQGELPALGHLVVFLDTDAPLRRADGLPPAIHEPQPLFDGVRVDVFAGGASAPCAGCSQAFELTEERVRQGASFVVRLDDAGGVARVRARMFRVLVGVETPPLETVVEVVAELPPQPEEGAAEVTLFLPTGGVGRPTGTLDAPVTVAPGRPDPSRVGSWAPAQRRGCREPPAAGEVCVPGGAFWMGHPLSPTLDVTSVLRPPPRLVVVSPFYMDAHETTVAEMRGAGTDADYAWSGSRDGTSIFDWCTYTSAPIRGFDNDDLPVNCIAWDTARAYCQSRGADLPTEAQREYVGGALASRLYVWGLDEARCTDAVWGRGGAGVLVDYAGDCRPRGDIGGLAPVSPPHPSYRDELELPTGAITEIAGNAAEWALDTYQPLDGSCWTASQVLMDPLCLESGTRHTVRGGSWGLSETFLRATFRFGQDVPSLDVGFRCARAAEPDGP